MDNRLELYLEGLSDVEISKRTGAGYATILAWRIRHGLPTRTVSHVLRPLTVEGRRVGFDLGYVMGVMKSDGYFRKDKRKNKDRIVAVCLMVKDRDFAYAFRDKLIAQFSYEPSVFERLRPNGLMYEIRLYSCSIGRFLDSFDCMECIDNVDFVHGFISGHLDGDGGVYYVDKGNDRYVYQIMHCTVNEFTKDILVSFIGKVGIGFRVHYRKPKGVRQGINLFRVLKLRDCVYYYNNIGSFIERKKVNLKLINDYASSLSKASQLSMGILSDGESQMIQHLRKSPVLIKDSVGSGFSGKDEDSTQGQK